ncbi:MAG: SRPBCC family protein [Gemmobacter sp.]
MTTTTDTDLTLTVSRLIPAAPERVFNAWLDPRKLVQFMVAGPEGGLQGRRNRPPRRRALQPDHDDGRP